MNKKDLVKYELELKEARVAFFEKYGKIPDIIENDYLNFIVGDFYSWYKNSNKNYVLLANNRNITIM